MNSISSKIVIGTVQFGLNYGINNKTGIPTNEEISKLLVFANQNGIETLDTAYDYGESEKRLGKLIKQNDLKFNLISKAPKTSNRKNIFRYFDESLKKLQKKYIYGYLLHDFSCYQNDPQIIKSLHYLKEINAVKKIGFSLENPEQLEKLFADNISFDLIQFPYNIVDRRFEPYFGELKRKNVVIHTRSVFLQGLFFMNPDELSPKLKPFKELLHKLKELSKKNNRTIANITLNFALQNEFINNVVLGIENIKQLTMNLCEVNNLQNYEKNRLIDLEIKKIQIPQELLLPSNWRVK